MGKKDRTLDRNKFFGLLQTALNMEYFLLSIPPYSVRSNSQIEIFKTTAWLEFSLTFMSALLEVGAMIYLYKYTTYTSIYNVLMTLRNVGNVTFGLISTYEIATKLGKLKNILNDIRNMDAVIKLQQKSFTTLKVKLMMWTCILMSVVIVNTTSLIIFSYKIYVEVILIYNSFKLYLRPFGDDLQFLLLLNLLKLYLESIHGQLREVATKAHKCESHKSRYHYPNTIKCEIADEIERLRKLYGRVNDLKNSVNEVFSLRIWFAITNGLLQYITMIYLVIVHLRNRDKNLEMEERLDFYVLLYEAAFLTLSFFQTVQISEQVSENGKSLRVRLQQAFSGVPRCERAEQELRIFSLELLHRDPNITACNVFTVNNKMKAGVITETLMTVIAIIQFERIGTTEENTAMLDYIADRS